MEKSIFCQQTESSEFGVTDFRGQVKIATLTAELMLE
jgi:hypothetical protein